VNVKFVKLPGFSGGFFVISDGMDCTPVSLHRIKKGCLLCRNPSLETKKSILPQPSVGAMVFRIYKNNLLLTNIGLPGCNFQYYFLQVVNANSKEWYCKQATDSLLHF